MNLWKNDKKSCISPGCILYTRGYTRQCNPKSERLKPPPVVKFYSTRRRSIPDVNDDNKPEAELVGKRGQWPEINGSLVGLQNCPETRNIVPERWFSKNFAKRAIPKQDRRVVGGRRQSRTVECLLFCFSFMKKSRFWPNFRVLLPLTAK